MTFESLSWNSLRSTSLTTGKDRVLLPTHSTPKQYNIIWCYPICYAWYSSAVSAALDCQVVLFFPIVYGNQVSTLLDSPVRPAARLWFSANTISYQCLIAPGRLIFRLDWTQPICQHWTSHTILPSVRTYLVTEGLLAKQERSQKGGSYNNQVLQLLLRILCTPHQNIRLS